MQEEEIKQLLNRYQEKTCTTAEAAFVEQWYAQWNDENPFSLSPEELEADLLEIGKHNKHIIDGRIKASNKVIKLHPLRFLKVGVAAASVILVVGLGIYFYNKQQYDASALNAINNIDPKNDISAGVNGATLTLANGRKILLRDAVNGQLAEEAGVSISKTTEGQIVYTLKNTPSKNDLLNTYNTLSTANGQQYQVVLPDQSRVWLNATSSIKFPATFAGLKNRIVELNGEAYFEVAKDRQHPFIVKTIAQEVRVLGTHFNINSYADEGSTKTSLLEGSVRVSSFSANDVLLKPGQQSTLIGNIIKITKADVEQSIDWKNSEFVFNNEPLESIMRKIARWYNVEVGYQDEQLRREIFGGTISRFKNVSKVLGMLEMTGSVHFKIEERRIIVTK